MAIIQGTEHGWLRGIAAIVLSLVICALLLAVVCLIPQSKLQAQAKKSAEYLTERAEFLPLLGKRVNTIQDNFADAELMGIAYGIDSRHPLASAVRAEYAQAQDETAARGFRRLVDGEESLNRTYSRYWHGSLVYVRPMLLFLDLKGIRAAVGGLILLLQLLVLLRLWQMGWKSAMVCYLLAFLVISPWMLFTCLEYSAVFLVLSVTTLWMLRLIRKGRTKHAAALMAGAGTVTCFVDFLTAETLTFTIPMFFLLLHLWKSGELKRVRDGLGKILGCGLWWAAGYVTAFCTKLALVYLVCGQSEVVESLRAGAVRIGGQVHMGNTNLSQEATTMQRLSGAIWHNLSALSFAEYDHMTMAGALLPALGVLAAAGVLIYLFHRELAPAVILSMTGLALLPYLRFLVLSNHAYMHFFFTYRAQLVTMLVLLYLVWACGLSQIPEMLGKERGNKNKNRKERNRKNRKRR